MTGIYNAIIENFDIIKSNTKAIVKIEFKLSCGCGVEGLFDLNNLFKIYKILDATNIKECYKKPCLVFIKEKCFRDMGNFLSYYDKEFFPIKEEDWVFYNQVKKFYEEIIVLKFSEE